MIYAMGASVKENIKKKGMPHIDSFKFYSVAVQWVLKMKNSMSKALWGVFFVLLGVALAGRAVGVFDFNIYFPGWWTLFIIRGKD